MYFDLKIVVKILGKQYQVIILIDIEIGCFLCMCIISEDPAVFAFIWNTVISSFM